MNGLYKALLLWVGTSTLPVFAQAGADYGFLNIAHLIPGDEPCHVTIDGATLVADGIPAATRTGWFLVEPGAKAIGIRRGDREASATLELAEGEAKLLAVFLEPGGRRRSNGEPDPPKIRLKSLPSYEARGFGLRLVSLCPEAETFQIAKLKIEAERLKSISIPKWTGKGFQILRDGKRVGRVRRRRESGAYYLLIGSDLRGGFAALLVGADRQEVPDYLKPKAEAPAEDAGASPR